MDAEKLVWDISKIFSYKSIHQEHCGDGVEYYGCKLLVDFGPFKKGDIVKTISIDSATHGDFTMNLFGGNIGATMVPVWTLIDPRTC